MLTTIYFFFVFLDKRFAYHDFLVIRERIPITQQQALSNYLTNIQGLRLQVSPFSYCRSKENKTSYIFQCPKITGFTGSREKPKLYIGSNDFKPKSVEEVYITDVASPDKFYVRKVCLSNLFNLQNKQITHVIYDICTLNYFSVTYKDFTKNCARIWIKNTV